MNETEFIAALRELPLHDGALGLNDDCAAIKIGAETLIITKDMMAEGVHFRPDANMADVAWKLIGVNLSDLASKGAEPIGVMLGHCLGDKDAAFLQGLNEALEAFNVPMLGGDTIAATGPRTFSLTAIGRATHTSIPTRSGAQAGDAIYVTGPLGKAMLGFEGDPAHLEAFNRPTPLLTEGHSLAPKVNAMMDVSDGLLLDAFRMATASDVSFHIDSSAVPVADTSRRDESMRWGDDYQLLFTAAPDTQLAVKAHKIGEVQTRQSAPLYLDARPCSAPETLGFRHKAVPPNN